MDSCTVDLGDVRAGIRANHPPAATGLRQALAAHAVDDPAAPRNFSVLFSRVRDQAHLLLWGGCFAARSFDPERIVRALMDHLGAHRPPPPGLVWVSSLAYVRDGQAVLLPARFNDDLRILDRQLRQHGYVAVDCPRALLDVCSGELVVADLLEPDPLGVALAVDEVVCRRPEPTVPYGRYPIERWVFVDYSGGWGPIGRASATRAAVLEILGGIEHPDGRLLDKVADLFARVKATSMFPGHPSAMLDAVLDRAPPV